MRRRRPFRVTEADVLGVSQSSVVDEADEDDRRNGWQKIRRNWRLGVTCRRELERLIVLSVVARKGP
jgi:hypothetical protein